MLGTVSWYDAARNFGFIKTESGNTYFVHRRNIEYVGGFSKNMTKGEPVEFEVATCAKGVEAVKVVRLAPIEPCAHSKPAPTIVYEREEIEA